MCAILDNILLQRVEKKMSPITDWILINKEYLLKGIMVAEQNEQKVSKELKQIWTQRGNRKIVKAPWKK